MGNFSILEVVLILLIRLAEAAVPIALIVWAIRAFRGSRKRDAELRHRIEALETERHSAR